MFKPTPTIPHPEEPQSSDTIEDINIQSVINRWFTEWEVQPEHQDFWRAWPIVLVPNLTYLKQEYPALAWSDRTEIDPTWCNPGVIAHEMCHVIWNELEEDERVLFSATYRKMLKIDPLLKYLFAKKPYMQMTLGYNNDREGHADTYRYLGQSMPPILRPYYPRLLA